MVQKPESDTEPKERRIDLNVPQVAGSAAAAVAAAVAASQLGVYGTIVGAGVMSVVATCGGSVFQHFFRRTGEQIREVTVQVTNPGGRQVAVRTRETTRGRGAAARFADDLPEGTPPDADRTRLLDLTAERTRLLDLAAERTRLPHADPASTRPPDQDRTRPLRSVPAPADEGTRRLRITGGGLPPVGTGADQEFSEATTHGTARRGLRKPVLAAAVVFVVSMLGITAFELVSGNDLSGGHGTTVGSVVGGGDSRTADPEPSTGGGGDEPTGPGTGASPSTGQGEDGASAPAATDEGGAATTPAPAPSPTDGATTPAPSPTASAPGDGTSAAPEQSADGGSPVPQDAAPSGETAGE